MSNVNFIKCCFCEKNIKPTINDPSIINITTNFDKDKKKQCSQNLHCHLSCFEKSLSPMAASCLMIEN